MLIWLPSAYIDRTWYLHRKWFWSLNLYGVSAVRRPICSPTWRIFFNFIFISSCPGSGGLDELMTLLIFPSSKVNLSESSGFGKTTFDIRGNGSDMGISSITSFFITTPMILLALCYRLYGRVICGSATGLKLVSMYSFIWCVLSFPRPQMFWEYLLNICCSWSLFWLWIILIGWKTFFTDVKWMISSFFATDPDKTTLHDTVHWETPLTDTGGLLDKLFLCCVSCIFLINPHLVAYAALHVLKFSPVSIKTVPPWLFMMTCLLKDLRLFLGLLLTLILRRSTLKNVCVIIIMYTYVFAESQFAEYQCICCSKFSSSYLLNFYFYILIHNAPSFFNCCI